MKGADQCPKCASRRWVDIDQPVTDFYARKIRVCGNCKTAWEPFDPEQLLDEGVPLSSFVEPCDNCAFRPGSHEQQDTERWRETIDMLKQGGSFYCHKGVPIDVESTGGDGFHYPKRKVSTPEGPQEIPDKRKLRFCRGYLRMLNRQLTRL